MATKGFTQPTDLPKTWDTSVLAVQRAVRKNHNSPKPPLDSLTGDLVLGPTIYQAGKVKAKGVGFDAQKRDAVRVDLNAFLRGVSKAQKPKLIGSSEVKADTTLRDLAVMVFNRWL